METRSYANVCETTSIIIGKTPRRAKNIMTVNIDDVVKARDKSAAKTNVFAS